MQSWQKALRPYRRRLRRETLKSAALTGLTAALAALAPSALCLRLLQRAIPWGAVIPLCLLFGAAAGGAFYALHRPTWRRTAARADELGLQNRAGTMVALADQDTLMARMQRQDAIQALSAHAPGDMRLPLPRGLLIALAGAAVCAALALLLPDGWLGGPPMPASQAEETEEARLARELLESLRKRIEEANLSEAERARLLSELAAAEAAARAGDMGLEQLAEVMRASGQLEQELDESAFETPWIEYLLTFDRTKALARAFIDGDVMALQRALAAEYQRVTSVSGTDQIIALMDLRAPIEQTLADHEPSDRDAYLAYVLANFGNDMMGAAEYVASRADPARVIYSAFSRLERQLITILNGVDVITEAEEDEDTVYIRQDGDGESGEDRQDTAAHGQQAGQDDPDPSAGLLLYTSDPDSMQGAGTGTRKQQHFAETEQVYEPSLDPYSAAYDPARAFRFSTDGVAVENGHIAYGQVYGVYYARLLDEMLRGVLPEELLPIIEAYFYGM